MPGSISKVSIAALWHADARFRVVIYAVLLLLAFQPINLLMQLGYGLSSLKPLELWLINNSLVTDDSWRPMGLAFDWVRTGPPGSLYREIFFAQHIKFQYPPTSLLIYSGLHGLGVNPSPLVLNGISRVLLLASAAGVGAITWMLLRRSLPARDDNQPTIMLATLLATGATFVFFPMTYGYLLGQLQTWCNAFFIFACLAWILDRRILAGILLGLVCLMKPQLSLFFLWGVLRKEWRFVAAIAATGVIGLALSITLYGWQNHIGYLEALSFMSRHGEAHLSNHSLNGLLHRLTGNDDGLVWSNETFPPFNAIVYVGSLLNSVLFIVVGLWQRGPMKGSPGFCQFLLAALVFTMASPIAWDAHYGVMAPAFAAVFCAILAMPDGSSRTNWLIGLAVAFTLAANHLPFVRSFAHTPLLVLQSYVLLAALILLVMLWKLSRPAEQVSEARVAPVAA